MNTHSLKFQDFLCLLRPFSCCKAFLYAWFTERGVHLLSKTSRYTYGMKSKLRAAKTAYKRRH